MDEELEGKSNKIIKLLQNNNIKFLNKDIAKSIKNVNDKLCYYEDKDGKYIIFARIDDGDVYVKDIRELKKVLITISNNFENIQSAVTNIRKAKEQIDYSLTDEDLFSFYLIFYCYFPSLIVW